MRKAPQLGQRKPRAPYSPRLADAILTDLAIHAAEAFGQKLGNMTEDGRPWPDFFKMKEKEREAWRAAVSVALGRHEELVARKA